jgi:tetratricopeptide (TPR) repeat protein
MKVAMRLALALAGVVLCVPALRAQQQQLPGQADGPMTENPRYNKATHTESAPANSGPPRSDNQSSSSDMRIDLSPPQGDQVAHPNGGRVADEALGTRKWDPMRALKDVEVGDYYYNARNYKAALSRYQEALEYKPRDADATFKLAQTLEKTKDYEKARVRYEEYLAILSNGPKAGEAKKALERLNAAK